MIKTLRPKLELLSNELILKIIDEAYSILENVRQGWRNRYRLYFGLLFSNKSIVTWTFRVEGFEPMHKMLVAIRGSEKNLAEKPLAIFDACPSPPLK